MLKRIVRKPNVFTFEVTFTARIDIPAKDEDEAREKVEEMAMSDIVDDCYGDDWDTECVDENYDVDYDEDYDPDQPDEVWLPDRGEDSDFLHRMAYGLMSSAVTCGGHQPNAVANTTFAIGLCLGLCSAIAANIDYDTVNTPEDLGYLLWRLGHNEDRYETIKWFFHYSDAFSGMELGDVLAWMEKYIPHNIPEVNRFSYPDGYTLTIA